jgi:hypothetical protein
VLLPGTVPVVETDAETVERQLGRLPLPFERVAARCGGGRPIVIEQPAVTPAGAPFPTTFWLTCPGLVAAIGRLESAGGVAALERRLADDPGLAAALADGRRRQIALRPGGEPLGIGGTRLERAVKCLHAHAAFALARPGYELGDRILAEVPNLWPSARCCSE